MAIPDNNMTNSIREGMAAGMATALASFIGGLMTGVRRARKKSQDAAKEMADVVERVEKLEAQAEKDRAFKQAMVTSQNAQMDVLEALLSVRGSSCDDCPASDPESEREARKKAAGSIGVSRKALQDYLNGLQ